MKCSNNSTICVNLPTQPPQCKESQIPDSLRIPDSLTEWTLFDTLWSNRQCCKQHCRMLYYSMSIGPYIVSKVSKESKVSKDWSIML